MYISIGGIFMGLFDNLLGNASKANLDDIRQDYAKLLANGESIQQAYEIFRDLFIFTDKRLILVDKQGITGKKHNIILYRIKVSDISVLKQLVISI